MENNDLQLDLSDFSSDNKVPDNMVPDDKSEQFYRSKPVAVKPPNDNSNVLDDFNSVGSDIFEKSKSSPTVSTYYPKELTEKYKGTSTYSPWMDPFADNETKTASNWSVVDAIGTGLSGMWDNAISAGKEYAMFYPRLGRSIATGNFDLLSPTEAETAVLGQEQRRIRNENPIFYDPNSSDDIFSRQFLSETLQNTGFTFGTMGGFALETALTSGMGKIMTSLFKVGAASKSFRLAEIGEDAINLSRQELSLEQQTQNLIRNGIGGRLGSKTIWDKALDIGSKLPFLDAFADTGRLLEVANKANLTTGELTMIGLGGLKRSASEWNFAMSEASVESGGVYGDTYDAMYDEYIKRGIKITPEILGQIRQDAMSGATKDYAINVAILGITNKITFGNMFRNFNTDSKFLNILRSEGERTISILGETEGGKVMAKSLPRSFWGVLGNKKDIVAKFGKDVYRKELKRDLIRGLTRFEITEGIQENLQEGTSSAIKDYYTNLYRRDVASWGDSFAEGVASQFNKQGLKTFLSGALMGFFTRPVTSVMQASQEKWAEYRAKKANPNHVDALTSTLNDLNHFYANPDRVLYEPIKAMKEQIMLNKEMAKSAAQGQKYDYFNNHDSALIKHALDAKRAGTFDTYLDFIRAYGSNFSQKEFKEATGIDIKDTGYTSVQDYTNSIADQIERFGEIHDKYTDRFSNYMSLETLTNDPYRKQRYAFNQMALRHAIQVVAFNEAKAQTSTIRAANISTNVSKIDAIGSAAASSFNTITSHEKAAEQVRILENEIQNLKETSGKDQVLKNSLKDKKEELKILKQWMKLGYEETTSAEDPEESLFLPINVRAVSDATREKMLDTLAKYYDLKNKQNNRQVPIKKDDVRKVLTDINDYQKLTEDTKEYIDAVNLLSDPDNFIKFAVNHKSNLVAAFARVAHDAYVAGLASESKIFKDYLDENPDDINTLLNIAKSPFNAYDSMHIVFKAIEKINSLAEDQRKKSLEEKEKKEEELKKKEEEFKQQIQELDQKREIDLKNSAAVNMAELSSDEQIDFIVDHYKISDDGKLIVRYYNSVLTNSEQTTHTIPLKTALKTLGKDSLEDVTEDEMNQFIIGAEQLLWNKENPDKAKPEGNAGQKSNTVVYISKKIRNLIGQKVSVKGRAGTIMSENGDYFVKYDDPSGDIVYLGSEETEPMIFSWEYDEGTGKLRAYEENPDASLSLDNFPEITLLDTNLTPLQKEITGITRDSKVLRVEDVSHNVNYISNDAIEIDGKEYIVTREDGQIVELKHSSNNKTIVYTKNEMYNDPTGLAAEHISLAEQFFLENMNATGFTSEEYDAMLQQLENELDAGEDTVVGRRRSKSKKSMSEEVRQSKIQEILDDITEKQLEIYNQILLAQNNDQLQEIPEDDRINIKKWATDAIEKLSKLDATDSIVFLTDKIINPLSKLNNDFNNRNGSTKRVNKKENKTSNGSKKTKSPAGKQSSSSEIQGGSIEGAADEIETAYNKKEVKVKLDDLITVAPVSITTKAVVDEVKKTIKFTKKQYTKNTQKNLLSDVNPFDDEDLYTC